MRIAALAFLTLCLLCSACSTLTYDLASLPFPVSAKPAEGEAEPFELDGKLVLWAHGLFGQSQPDVAALIEEQCGDCAGVADLRVSAGTSFHDWLVTHLTLGLIRMKSVTITGQRIAR